MTRRPPPLSCYRCGAPASVDDEVCTNCAFPLDWGAISDLRSLDYLRMRIEQWARERVVPRPLANRLLGEANHNHATLLRLLVEPRRAAEPEAAPETAPEAASAARDAVEPAAPVPEHAPPRAAAPPFAPPLAEPGAFPVVLGPPSPAPAPKPRRRPIVDVLLDVGTARLLLYTGALMLAVGMMIWLREALRVQLQRPVIQASLLGLATFAALAGGTALVVRAKGRVEQRLIGRGTLFLGMLLLPLNPWFWLRTGLIEDRGNAWIVGLVSFAVSLAVGLGLADRVFVYFSYAAALLTGWLLTFKVTGGAAPGAYALVLTLVSGAYLHAERIVAASKRDGWERIGGAFFLAGHVGVVLTLVFYTNVVRLLPPGLFAAFHHFDASGYTPWIGVAVALLAAEAYLYSAWRRQDARYTYVGVAAALWSAALSLLAIAAGAGAWIFACGASALAAWGLGALLAREPLWGPPLRVSSRVLAWTGFAATTVAAIGYVTGLAELQWTTAAGAALLVAFFALETLSRDRVDEAFATGALGFMIAGYALDRSGLEWAATNTILALGAAAVPFAAARLLAARTGAWTGARYIAIFATSLVSLAAAWIAVAEVVAESYFRPLPLAVAVTCAFGANGWHSVARSVRYPMFAAAALFLQLAAALAAFGLEARWAIDARYRALLFAPYAFAALGAWLAIRRIESERARELSGVARAAASLASIVTALVALPLVVDGLFSPLAALLFAIALALAAAVPLAIAALARENETGTIEGSIGVLLATAAYGGLAASAANRVEEFEPALFWAILGLGPALLLVASRALERRAPAIALPASITAIVGAGILTAVVAVAAFTVGAAPFSLAWRVGFASLAVGVAGHALLRLARALPEPIAHAWAADAALTAGIALYYAIGFSPPGRGLAYVAVAGSALLLGAGVRAIGGARRQIGRAALAIGHTWIAVALFSMLASEAALDGPVSYAFAGIVALAALANAVAAFLARRDSWADRIHRTVALAVGIVAASVALHAFGRTTPRGQAEPLALLLVAIAAAAALLRSAWAKREMLDVAHVAALLLVAVATIDALLAPNAWSAAAFGRFAAEIAVFYAVAAARRDQLSIAASTAATAVALFAFGEALGVAPATRFAMIAVAATGAAVAVTRLGATKERWFAPPVARCAHALYAVALVAEAAVLVPDLALGSPRLAPHVVAFGVLTACAVVLGRTRADARPLYTLLSRSLAIATYVVAGLWLGYHPWRDSAFYTLPVGALLVALGIATSRSPRPEGSRLLLWLGSLLAAAPMLLHALDNRFLLGVSPLGYDAATLAIGLALAICGVLFQLRAPSVVGTAVFAADLFVVAFSRIEWEEIPLSIYIATIGALLFGASWLLLYRKEDLLRFRDYVRARRELFQQWR